MDKNVWANTNTSHCLLGFSVHFHYPSKEHRDQFASIKGEKEARSFMWMYHNVASLLVQPVSVHRINKFMFILKVRLPIWPRTQWIRKLSFETEEAQTRAEKNGLLESSVEWMDKRKCIFAWFPTMRLPFSDYFSSIVVQCNRIPLQCRRRRRRLFHFSLPCYYFLSSVCTVSSLPTKVVQDYRDNIGRAKSEKKIRTT